MERLSVNIGSLILLLLFGYLAYQSNGEQDDLPINTVDLWAFYSNDWTGATTPDTVSIPHKWPNDELKTFGYGMYKGIIRNASDYSDLAVQMPNIISAYAFIVDGDTLYQAGVPSTSRKSEKIRTHRHTVGIPGKYYADGKSPELTFLVSNHSYHVGGFLSPLVYGDREDLEDIALQNTLVEGIQSGALGLMSIFLFVYFIFRRKDMYILFFAVLSFGLMLRILITGNQHILEFFPGVDGAGFLKITLVTFYIGITLNYAIMAGLFPSVVPRWSQKIVWIVGILSLLAVVVLPLHIGSYTVPFFQLFSVIAGTFLITLTFKAALRHLQGAKTVLIGGIIALTFLINDILFNNQVISTGDWAGWGVLIYLFLLIVVISRRFSSAMENEEGLNEKLKQLNRSLEKRVRQRTQKLELLKQQIEEEAQTVKQVNDELLKFKEEEESVLRTMVHDLKSPFNKIKGIAQIMKMNEKFKDGEDAELNEMILKIAEEGRLLIDDLNVLTMYEAHVNDQDSYGMTCINTLVEDSVRSHKAYAKSKDINLDFHYNHHIKSWINPNMLSRIIDNLLSNAIKFSDSGKSVQISCIRKTNAYEISVCDEGPGFNEEDKRKLFGKFQKLSARPTKGESSTGLGLSIVKNLTDLMGGQISLKSEPGKGACFYLHFPVVRDPVS